MIKEIEPRLKLISDFLKVGKSNIFVIPEYQREYSWNIANCDKLWQDIEAFIESDHDDPYFFGTIILDCSEQGKLNIIDGQQRTSTFLLLFKALLLTLNESISNIPSGDEESISLKFGLESKRNTIMSILYKADAEEIPVMLKDANKIKNILFIQNDSINEKFANEIKIILESKDFSNAESEVHKIPRKQKDNKYTNHFRNFKFFHDKLRRLSSSQLNSYSKILLDKCQVIEIKSWQTEQAITMFNSLNSTGMPLTDADIISAQLYSKVDKNKEEFNDLWRKLIDISEELKMLGISNIDAILQQFMYYNRAQSREYIKNNSISVTTPGLRKYYTKINTNLLENPIEFTNNLLKIGMIWLNVKDYSMTKLLLKFNENAKIFFISYLNKFLLDEISEKIINEISIPLIRLFSVLELVDAGYSSKNFKTFLFEENLKLVDPNVKIEEIDLDFDNHLIKTWKNEELRELLMEYENNSLVFLNEFLYASIKNQKYTLTDRVNVEHIMPSSGRNVEMIRLDAKINTKEEFNSLVNKLGNKILLEEDINKSIGNEWFKSKKQKSVKRKSGYKDSVYVLAENLTRYIKDTWEKDDINAMTTKAIDRILKFIFNEK